MPQQYRKKPVVIEAEQVPDPSTLQNTPSLAQNTFSMLADWCGGNVVVLDGAWFIDIPTLEGVMRASVGDYVIKGVKGEFYPCKPDIFEATYDAVPSPYKLKEAQV